MDALTPICVPSVRPRRCLWFGVVYLTGPAAMERLGGQGSFEIYAHAMRDGVCLLTAALPPATLVVRPQIEAE